jgi:Na+:H+ antiporter, NhaC family
VDIIASFFICFILFIVSVLKGIFVGYALAVGLIIFALLSLIRGFKFIDIISMIYKGGRKSFLVLQIFLLIGAIVSIWMAAGTVPAIVYYGISLLNPRWFILSAFIISSIVSVLIGTSFGTVGTAGVALMVMARGGGVNTAAAAGAIIAGAYFGDRCSPMSSSANLVAHITETDLYTNIRNMIKTSIIPLILSLVLYGIVSYFNPFQVGSTDITVEISSNFNIGIAALIPAAIILVFSLFRFNLKLAMLISIIAASVIAVAVQGSTTSQVIRYIVTGYSLEGESYLSDIIKGGGIISMLRVSVIVFISSAFTGIFEGTGMLQKVEGLVMKVKGRAGLFAATIGVSTASAAFGCTQVLAIILTRLLVWKAYKENGESSESLSVDIENTAVVIAPLIPWNIAVLVPLTTLMVGPKAILYCFYLYLLPLTNLLYLAWRKVNNKKVESIQMKKVENF